MHRVFPWVYLLMAKSKNNSQKFGSTNEGKIKDVLTLLDIHYKSFEAVRDYAEKYGHPHPCDTRAWSQIIVSALTGVKGLERKKGADLDDGSDVKAANCWGAIDTPRFNGCIKSGTKSDASGTMASLDEMPRLFFVLWDNEPKTDRERCRIWMTLPNSDQVFREMCKKWYKKRENGEIRSDNFQLHPPRNKNSDVIRNTCGNLEYPLIFSAEREDGGYTLTTHRPQLLTSGRCKISDSTTS